MSTSTGREDHSCAMQWLSAAKISRRHQVDELFHAAITNTGYPVIRGSDRFKKTICLLKNTSVMSVNSVIVSKMGEGVIFSLR